MIHKTVCSCPSLPCSFKKSLICKYQKKNIENVIKFSNLPIFYKNVNIHIIGKIICLIFTLWGFLHRNVFCSPQTFIFSVPLYSFYFLRKLECIWFPIVCSNLIISPTKPHNWKKDWIWLLRNKPFCSQPLKRHQVYTREHNTIRNIFYVAWFHQVTFLIINQIAFLKFCYFEFIRTDKSKFD